VYNTIRNKKIVFRTQIYIAELGLNNKAYCNRVAAKTKVNLAPEFILQLMRLITRIS